MFGNISNLKPVKGHILVNLNHSISLGDTVSFEKENTKYKISELIVKNTNVKSASKGTLVEIGRMKGNINIGDKVYRIESKELSNIAKESYSSENKKIKLDCNITLKKNESIDFFVSTSNNNSNLLFKDLNISLTSDEICLEAKSKPITKERIIEQLTKTTDTIFEFNNINVELDDNLFLPSIKILNELRRTALDEIYLSAKTKLFRTSPKLNDVTYIPNNVINNNKTISVLLNILDKNEDYSNLENVDQVYIPLKYFSDKDFKDSITTITNKFDTYIYLPTIIKANYKNLLNNLINESIDNFSIKGFVISNLGNLPFISEIKEKFGGKYKFIGNYTLNVYNNETEKQFKNLGLEKLTISPELDNNTIQSLITHSYAKQELIVYGKTPLMNMNYCLLGKTNKCYPTCGIHCQDKKQFYLKDRLGLEFRIIPDNIQTVTTIYNSKTISIESTKYDVSSYRIDILDENVNEINSIVDTVLSGKRFEGKEYTNGNMNREI